MSYELLLFFFFFFLLVFLDFSSFDLGEMVWGMGYHKRREMNKIDIDITHLIPLFSTLIREKYIREKLHFSLCYLRGCFCSGVYVCVCVYM